MLLLGVPSTGKLRALLSLETLGDWLGFPTVLLLISPIPGDEDAIICGTLGCRNFSTVCGTLTDV